MSKQAYLGRIAEMAVRLATIRAAGHRRANGSDRPVGHGMGRRCRGYRHHRHDATGPTITLAPTVRGEFTEKLIQDHPATRIDHSAQAAASDPGSLPDPGSQRHADPGHRGWAHCQDPERLRSGNCSLGTDKGTAREPAAKLSGNCWRVLAWFLTRGKHLIPYILLYIYIYIMLVSMKEGSDPGKMKKIP